MQSTTLSKSQIEKLGNTLIYLSENVGDFGKTKALKLLFLLEQKSIKNLGVPFFGFDFKVWQFGPVVEEVFNDLSDVENSLLRSYIKRASWNPDEFVAIANFNDDEFSINDIELMSDIAKFAKHKTAKDLVGITHGKNSLWLKAVEENNLSEKFAKKDITKTNISIDFSSILEDDYLKERYENALDYLELSNHLKS